jgi:hypothetical protein
MKRKIALFALINSAVMALILCGNTAVILTTVIALGVVGFEIALFLLLFNSNKN